MESGMNVYCDQSASVIDRGDRTLPVKLRYHKLERLNLFLQYQSL